MGYEGKRRPEKFFQAAMAEDPTPLREMQSHGGKAAAAKRSRRKQIRAERERAPQSEANAELKRLEEERAIQDAEAERVLHRDAFANEMSLRTPEQN